MKTKSITTCGCGHDKRDHAFPVLGTQAYGQCKVCLCDRYAKPDADALATAAKAADRY